MLKHAPLVWAEIAVQDIERAIEFYTSHFSIDFHRELIGETGMDMAIITSEDREGAGVALVKHPMMKPTPNGSIVYLHLSDKLTPLVEKVAKAGVKILLPVTPIKDGEVGYISLFEDSEGNTVGLWSKES